METDQRQNFHNKSKKRSWFHVEVPKSECSIIEIDIALELCANITAKSIPLPKEI